MELNKIFLGDCLEILKQSLMVSLMRYVGFKMKDSGYFFMFTDWRQLPIATDTAQMADLIWF